MLDKSKKHPISGDFRASLGSSNTNIYEPLNAISASPYSHFPSPNNTTKCVPNSLVDDDDINNCKFETSLRNIICAH
jgi:hypothetical protein